MKRLREDLHRLRFVLPLTFAAMLLLRWAVFRGQPERLAELPLGPAAQWTGIKGGEVIYSWIAANDEDIEAFSRPINGGRGKLLLRQNSAKTETGTFIAGPYLYCVNVWYPPQNPHKGGGAQFSNVGDPVVRLEAGKQPSPVTPTQKVLGLLSQGNRGRLGPRSKTLLTRVPLAGGASEKVALDTTTKEPIFYNVAVAGNQIFWTRRTPISKEDAAKYSAMGDVAVMANQELMATPVNGGPARRIYGGLFAGARLFSTEEGVYWRVAVPGKERTTDLVYVASDTLKVAISRDCSFEPASPPVVCKGKAYWINEVYTAASLKGGGFSNPARRDIISANLDGTSQRVVMNLMAGDKPALGLTRLFSYQDRLYGIALDGRQDNDGETTRRTSLFLIDPDREPVAKALTALPHRSWDRGVFENGYYYFVVSELKDNLLDWSTDGASKPEKYYLYRWKLPAGNAS